MKNRQKTCSKIFYTNLKHLQKNLIKLLNTFVPQEIANKITNKFGSS